MPIFIHCAKDNALCLTRMEGVGEICDAEYLLCQNPDLLSKKIRSCDRSIGLSKLSLSSNLKCFHNFLPGLQNRIG